MRTTAKDLQQYATVINSRLELPPERAFYVQYAYGRPRLEQYVGKGSRDVSPRLTPGELKQYLDGMLEGMEQAFINAAREENEAA
jgi:hypothetical protein